jgi:gamma-glutamyltranspeptidase/glutathione hydrolase
VAETILNYTEFGLSLHDSISAIRYHHQWQPDILTIDPPGPKPEVLAGLKKMGYDVRIKSVPCEVMGVTKEGNILRAVADPRDIGIGLAQ